FNVFPFVISRNNYDAITVCVHALFIFADKCTIYLHSFLFAHSGFCFFNIRRLVHTTKYLGVPPVGVGLSATMLFEAYQPPKAFSLLSLTRHADCATNRAA
ncbi:hypothetical protein EZS27_037268, partial [termite gut metagenome]